MSIADDYLSGVMQGRMASSMTDAIGGLFADLFNRPQAPAIYQAPDPTPQAAPAPTPAPTQPAATPEQPAPQPTFDQFLGALPPVFNMQGPLQRGAGSVRGQMAGNALLQHLFSEFQNGTSPGFFNGGGLNA